MGNGLSVSSVVEKLHALESEARSTALDNLCEQNPEIQTYLKTKYFEESLPLSSQKTSGPRHLQVLSIDRLVPDTQKLSSKYAPWSKDIASFWRSEALTIVPEETHCRPLRFIYEAKLREQCENQESCLRRRFLALFWFDYFVARYPGRGYDHDFKDLNREIAGVETIADDVIVSTLRDRVKAGRRYNKLTERFGNGILLIIPSSQKLPLGNDAFQEFVSPLAGDWEKCAEMESMANLGASIRQSLLERCLIQRAQSSPRAATIVSPKATKRKMRGPSPQSKKQKNRPANGTVRSKTTSLSTNLPTTPRIFEGVYYLEVFRVSNAIVTSQPKKSLDPAETAQETYVNEIAIQSHDESSDQDPGSSIQLSNERSLHLCGEENLHLAAITDAVDWGTVGHSPSRQHQDIGEVPRSTQYTTNQRVTQESGDTALPNRTEKQTKARNTSEVQRDEDPMLSDLTADDWESDIHLFRPMAFNQDAFAPVSTDSDPLLGTSSSPI
ncbi:hypothetical protein WAI453_006423 [Rhynchosporium graminicola]